jgi:threonine aldolase
MGGGMRQAGFIAAAGLYALQNNVERLLDDHQRAKEIGKTLEKLNWVEEVTPIETNIVIFSLKDKHAAKWVEKLKSNNILCFPFGPDKIRMVTLLY